MTNYFTHKPCEVLALNGLDLTLARNYLYTLDAFANYGPLTHFIVFNKIDGRNSFPAIENSVVGVNSSIQYQMYFKIYNKKTGEEVEIVNGNLKLVGVLLQRYASGVREFTEFTEIIPGGN